MKYGEMSLLDFVFPLIWETGERERVRVFRNFVLLEERRLVEL